MAAAAAATAVVLVVSVGRTWFQGDLILPNADLFLNALRVESCCTARESMRVVELMKLPHTASVVLA